MITVVFNQKGGVGKSTITVNLAAIAARRGLRTLVVDLDPQANTTRYLLERASWYCRDHRHSSDEGDGSAQIVFSNRSGMSYSELCEYLNHLKQCSGVFDVRIDWTVIREDQVISLSSGKRMGLQIADAVAGSHFYGVQESQYGFVEPRYAELLKPVVYRGKDGWLGYGLKLWPRDVRVLLEEERYRWIGETYE